MKWGLCCRECNNATSVPTLSADFLDRLKELFPRLRPFYRLLRREDQDGLIHDELLDQLKFLNRHRMHLDEVEAVNEFSPEVRAAHG
jgi:hypothetical protein